MTLINFIDLVDLNQLFTYLLLLLGPGGCGISCSVRARVVTILVSPVHTHHGRGLGLILTTGLLGLAAWSLGLSLRLLPGLAWVLLPTASGIIVTLVCSLENRKYILKSIVSIQ